MNRTTRLLFPLAIAAATLLAACNLPTETPVIPIAPACSPAELVAPVLAGPAEGDVVDTSPTFFWSYPIYCDPDRIAVQVCTDSSCANVAASGAVDRPGFAWTPSASLEGAMPYFWRAAAIAFEDGVETYGPWSASVSFFTGPQCDAPSMYPPILILPAEGAWVDPVETSGATRPLLQWSRRSECLPPAYRIEIYSDPEIDAAVVSHVTDGPVSSWRLDSDLEENSTYYWRVAETDGITTGPWSYTHSFQTNPIPTGELAVIAGVVWHDRCFIDWEGGPTAPGCIDFDPYPIGDGIRTADEIGIPGVTVSYVAGECPYGGGWFPDGAHEVHSPTNASGEYYQWLAPGTYCFSIQRSAGGNADIFYGGSWTAPWPTWSYAPAPLVSVTVGEGEARVDVDFGYDFLFGSSVTPGGISGRVWNDVNADGILDPGEPGLGDVEV